MKKYLKIFIVLFCLQVTEILAANYFVTTVPEINTALLNIQPGDTITMKNQVWMNANIVFAANGSLNDSIYLVAETPGMVRLSGTSNLRIGGSYLVVEGLYFVNGYSPSGAIIEFRRNASAESNNCRLTNTAIVDYNPSNKSTDYKWISLYGTNNRVDHCYLKGKNHAGTTLVVWLSAAPNYHRIDNNYFAYRPALGENGGETIRVGTSDWSMYNSYTIVERNYFEECDGEAEIISNKSCENIYRYNTFVKCSGALTLRHGNRCTVESNFFFGGKKSGSGGIRIIGEDHKVFNNYFFELTGTGIRSAVSIMNGIPDSPLNGYYQVKNAVVAFNTYVNCTSNFNIGTGASSTQSLPAENCIISNNLVKGIISPLIRYEAQPINPHYEGNIMFGASLGIPTPSGIKMTDPLLELSEDGLYRPKVNSPAIDSAAGDYSFVVNDIDGHIRTGLKDAGADEISNDPVMNRPLKSGDTGPTWLEIILAGPVVVSVEAGHNILYDAVAGAQPFSVIELAPGIYSNDSKIIIDKILTIRAVPDAASRPVIQNTGGDERILEIAANASLYLNGIELDGLAGTATPARFLITSPSSGTGTYRLIANNCSFKNVDDNNSGSFFYAYPGTVADSVKFRNCLFTNSAGTGIKLDEETANSGKYNVKYFEAYSSTFWDIPGTGISIYGGDENISTAAPVIKINHCTFNNVGSSGNKILDLKDSDGAEVVSSLFTNSSGNVSAVVLSGASSKIHYCDTFNTGQLILARGAVKGSGMMGVDPLYYDPANGNFMLSTVSPILNRAYDFYAMGDLRWDPSLSSFEEKYVVEDFGLLQNYPNPFNPSTKIRFNLAVPEFIRLSVYDINGSLVENLVNENSEKGMHEVTWKPSGVSSGVYFCRLVSGIRITTIKMIYLR